MAAINVTSGDGDTHTIRQGARAVVRLSNGRPYVIVENSTDDQIQVWKGNATTPASFSEPDVGNGPTGTVWGSCSICVDVNDVIHIAYCTDEGKASQLRYVQFASDAFLNDTQVIDDLEEDPGAISNLQTAIAIDSNNKPHIAFCHYAKTGGSTTYEISYINNVDANWNAGVYYEVEGSTNVKDCTYPDISIDKDNKPVISYSNMTDYDVGTAIGNQNDAESFTLQDIDTNLENTSGYNRTSICVDSSGNHYVAWRENADNFIFLRKHTYGVAWDTWVANTTGSDIGRNPSLAVDGNDVYIFYQVLTDIFYEKVTGGSSWQGDVALETGQYNTVKAKWAYAVDRDSGGTNRGGGSGRVEIDYVFTDETATPDILFNSLTLGVAGLSINVHETINTVESLAEGLPLPGISKFESLTLAEFRQMLISLNPSVFKSLTVAEYINLFVSGGNTNVFNNITIQEVVAAAIKLTGIDIFDSITIQEAITTIIKLVDIDKHDQITINEAIIMVLGILASVSDTINIQEVTAATIELLASVSDKIDITEYAKANIPIPANIFDNITIQEIIISAMKLADIGRYEQITIVEATTVAVSVLNLMIESDDVINITEVIMMTVKVLASTSDTIDIIEYIKANISISANISDVISATESIIMLIPISLSASDTLTIIENISTVMSLARAVSDSITIAEFKQALIDLNPNVFENLTIAEYINLLTSIGINVFDNVILQEVLITAMKLAGISRYDQITINEAVTMTVGIINLMITSDEIINITEYIAANIPIKTDISDIVNLTESIIMALPISISVSDTPVIIENIVTAMNLAGVSISDSVIIIEYKKLLFDMLFLSSYDAMTIREYQNLLFDLFSSSYENLAITEYVMASILVPTAYPLLMTLAKSTEFGIGLSKSTEFGIGLSKSTEFGIGLSKFGGGSA